MKIKNDYLELEISPLGAELRSIVNRSNNKETMWSGNSDWWGRISPVLFPVIGHLNDGEYRFKGKTYKLPNHGFLRDQAFEIERQDESNVWMSFTANAHTKEIYPFSFTAKIGYTLSWNKITVHWSIKNESNETMPFSIGAHPAFLSETGVSKISFEKEEGTPNRYVLVGPAIGKSYPEEPVSFVVEPEIFMNDAVIYDKIKSVTLMNEKTTSVVKVSFPGFKYVGVWSPVKDGEMAPFVCIEPWMGIADLDGFKGEITEKTGINLLNANETSDFQYTIEIV